MRDQQCNMVIVDGSVNMNINKVIESSRNWKLANDVELLKRLEKFSDNIICNASFTLTSMDNLEDSLSETFLRVRTVANKFQAIADNQFIENRVQEEEEFVLASEKKTDSDDTRVSPETSKTQLVDSIKQCQNALSRKFETVQVSGIDSEDEMTNSSPVVLVPKNVYKERRLPHLIGGKEFIADETLGLMANTANADDDSIESEEDMDETDRSSYYSNSLKKSVDNQGETAISSLSSSVLQENLADTGSTYRNIGSKVSEDKSELVTEDDRVSSSANNIPVRNDFLSDDRCGLFEENKGLFAENSSLFDENSAHLTEQLLDENGESQNFEVEKEKLTPASDPNVGATREKLLAGRNFTSFKEDLARVLSNSGPNRKLGSHDQVGLKKDVTSPVTNKSIARCSEDEAEEDSEVSPSPMSTQSQSTPESSNLPPAEQANPFEPTVTHGGNIGSVTLPNLSTTTLENLAKGRPKLKGNRRPPTRKHRRGGSLDAESPVANAFNSAHSDDVSNQESASTQPGSNILSPATDEEDLFVLPAFDLPTDPPSRGLFFSNTLLSPGATIDDGSSSTSPLFSSISTLSSAQPGSPDRALGIESPIKREPLQSTLRKSLQSESYQVDNEVVNTEKTAIGHFTDTTDLFFSEVRPVSKSITKSTPGKSGDSASSVTDLFPSIRSVINTSSSREDDIFSSRSSVKTTPASPSAVKKPGFAPNSLFAPSNVITTLSSSPSLFNDSAESTHKAKSDTKTKTSQKSGLRWDLLGSDDYGEDLFRSSKRDPVSRTEGPKLMGPSLMDTTDKKENIFSPTNFEKSKDGMFFEDDAFSSADIFSESSSFMRLSLPSNAKDSLFASDDDDDDSLFKTAKTSTADGTTKPSGTSEMKSSKGPSSDSTFRELLKDPLMCMDDVE